MTAPTARERVAEAIFACFYGGTGDPDLIALAESIARSHADAAPGPPRATLRPEGHVGPFPCEACSDREYCIAELVCEVAEDYGDE